MRKYILHQNGVAAEADTGDTYPGPLATVKLGVDVHQSRIVVVAQEDHATPKPARSFAPEEFEPWVERLLARGHRVFAVYEACGFGFGLQRALSGMGATCHVIAPCRLDERRERVKTDGRDAAALCQRLSRYVDGNTRELAVIRVPTEAEEAARAIHRQREALVRARTKLQAQGRSLLLNHRCGPPGGLPVVAHWWRARGWKALEARLPGWLRERLEATRPVLTVLDAQIATLSAELESAAPAGLPTGLGKLTSVVVGREICDWSRFHNRRQVSRLPAPSGAALRAKAPPFGYLAPLDSPASAPANIRAAANESPAASPSTAEVAEGKSGGWQWARPAPAVRIGRAGLECSPVLLPPLVPCAAASMVRFQPTYPPVQKRLAILAKGAKATGAARKKAIVAVARQLAVDLWRLNTGRCSAEALGLHCPAPE